MKRYKLVFHVEDEDTKQVIGQKSQLRIDVDDLKVPEETEAKLIQMFGNDSVELERQRWCVLNTMRHDTFRATSVVIERHLVATLAPLSMPNLIKCSGTSAVWPKN